jgi:hypothetical protein
MHHLAVRKVFYVKKNEMMKHQQVAVEMNTMQILNMRKMKIMTLI